MQRLTDNCCGLPLACRTITAIAGSTCILRFSRALIVLCIVFEAEFYDDSQILQRVTSRTLHRKRLQSWAYIPENFLFYSFSTISSDRLYCRVELLLCESYLGNEMLNVTWSLSHSCTGSVCILQGCFHVLRFCCCFFFQTCLNLCLSLTTIFIRGRRTNGERERLVSYGWNVTHAALSDTKIPSAEINRQLLWTSCGAPDNHCDCWFGVCSLISYTELLLRYSVPCLI